MFLGGLLRGGSSRRRSRHPPAAPAVVSAPAQLLSCVPVTAISACYRHRGWPFAWLGAVYTCHPRALARQQQARPSTSLFFCAYPRINAVTTWDDSPLVPAPCQPGANVGDSGGSCRQQYLDGEPVCTVRVMATAARLPMEECLPSWSGASCRIQLERYLSTGRVPAPSAGSRRGGCLPEEDPISRRQRRSHTRSGTSVCRPVLRVTRVLADRHEPVIVSFGPW